jgi:GWxTD domain-containing protein
MALTGAVPKDVPAQAEPAVAVRAVRFYRTDNERTRVRAFVEVPYALLTPATAGSSGGGILSYQVGVRITDSSGLTLHSDSWRNHADGGLRAMNASAVEILEFMVAPGRYDLEVTVTDSVTGGRFAGTARIEGFEGDPTISDLLLSPAIRSVSPGDSMPREGELGFGQRGEILVTAAANLGLTPLRAQAHYLLEVYAEQAATGTVTLSVRDQAGKTLIRARPMAVAAPAGGQVLTGAINLEGLPPGSYELVVEADVAGTSVVRTAPFTMADLEATLARDAQRRQVDRVTDQGYFEGMNKEALDSAAAPLYYLAEPADRLGSYDDILSVDGRRRYLTDFWQKRDPDPATPANEARIGFYNAIAYANEHYRERGKAGRAGWRTDRGRIYARFGAPDEVLTRLAAGRAPPYEVWRYTRQRDRYYVFADRSRLDTYVLLCSNDLKEQCRNDWREVVGEEAVRDIGQFLGIDFYSGRLVN